MLQHSVLQPMRLRTGPRRRLSVQGPQNGYRIRGNRCASSIGGGVKTQSTEPDIIDSSCKNSPSRDIRSRHGIIECKVVLDRIDIPSGAAKLDEQEPCRNKTHLTSQFASSDTDDSFREKQIAKPPVKWPPLSNTDEWRSFEEAVLPLLPSFGSIAKRLECLEDSIYKIGSEKFGVFVPGKTSKFKNSKATRLCIKLVCDKNDLLEKIQDCCCPEELSALTALLSQVKDRLRKVRKVERAKIRKAKFKAAAKAFRRDPFQAGKDVLDPRKSGFLRVSKEELDKHKNLSVSDPYRSDPLPPLEGLPDPPHIRHKFSGGFVSRDDFNNYVHKRSNSSAPGINMVPYKVYKACDDLSRYLYYILLSCFRSKHVPINWRIAKEIYIPKKDNPNEQSIADFRSIALLNVEGKIFFGLIAKRLFTHIVLKNHLIDTSMQKGCMENTPGCWEHMSMVWAALKDARVDQSDVSTIWLDVANAYGSVPHQLIFLALRRYGVPKHFIDIIQNYFSAVWSKSFSDSCPSSWHCQEKGIFAGCTIAIILFLVAINLIIEYTVNCSAKKFITSAGKELPLVRAFMDDMNLMALSVKDTQTLLLRCSRALKWARMDYNISKSRSIVVKRGRSLNTTPFTINSQSNGIIEENNTIPSIHTNPIKFLGRVIDGFISDRRAIDELHFKVEKGLSQIDKSYHKGSQKVWILQYLFIPRIRWPLMIYEVSMSVAQKLESSISVKLRKWLGLHHSTTNLCLYSSISPCRLPISSLTSIFKASKVSGDLMLRDSRDKYVSASCPILETGTSWRVREAVNTAETTLFFKQILGHTQTNKAGLGRSKFGRFPPRGSKEHRKLVSDTVVQQEGESDFLKASSLVLQCSWVKWKHYIQNNLRWKDVLAMPPNLLSFCLGATYNVLPCPSNLVRWKQGSDPSCVLCHKAVGTIIHSLTCCPVALQQGRVTFRHDSILNRLIGRIQEVCSSIKSARPLKTPQIKFVREGTRVRSTNKSKAPPSGLLHFATDWLFLFDLGKFVYSFPSCLANTDLRPDICIYSKTTKRVILIELTSPREENTEEWHTTKTANYHDLCDSIRSRGWHVDFFAIEVGARGYCAPNVLQLLLRLGFTNKLAHTTAKDVSMISMQASFCIWLASSSSDWPDIPLVGTPDNPVDNPSVQQLHLCKCKEAQPSCSIPVPPCPTPPISKESAIVPPKSPTLNAAPSSPSPPGAGTDSRFLPPVTTSSESVTPSSSVIPPVSPEPSPIHPVASPQENTQAHIRPSCSGPICNKPKLPPQKPIQIGLPAGLVNLGATCYINSILQALFAIPEFSFKCSPETAKSPEQRAFVNAFRTMMTLMKSTNHPINPRLFIKELGTVLSIEFNKIFTTNSEHDVPEVLLPSLEFLVGRSSFLDSKVKIHSYVRKTCMSCFSEFDDTEENFILPVALGRTVQEAVNSFHQKPNAEVHCRICKKITTSSRKAWFSDLPEILFIHLKRFKREGNITRKDYSPVIHGENISISVIQDSEVLVPTQVPFRLRAVINHSGPFGRGHYWTNVRYNGSEDWVLCNDQAVIRDSNQQKVLDPLHPYVLVYAKV